VRTGAGGRVSLRRRWKARRPGERLRSELRVVACRTAATARRGRRRARAPRGRRGSRRALPSGSPRRCGRRPSAGWRARSRSVASSSGVGERSSARRSVSTRTRQPATPSSSNPSPAITRWAKRCGHQTKPRASRPTIRGPPSTPRRAGPPATGRGLRSSGSEGALDDDVLRDRRSADEMLLHDPLEDRRIASPVPGSLGVDDGNRAPVQILRQFARVRWIPPPSLSPSSLSVFFRYSQRKARAPSRSTSVSSGHSRGRCAAVRPECPGSRLFSRGRRFSERRHFIHRIPPRQDDRNRFRQIIRSWRAPAR